MRVFDRDDAGSRLKLLALMDEFTREGLAIRVGHSFRAAEVKEVLRELGAKRGFPQYLRLDNGSEFIAGIIKEFLVENNIKAAYIEPGNPWQNGTGDAFQRAHSETNVGEWKSSAIGARQQLFQRNGANSTTRSDPLAV